MVKDTGSNKTQYGRIAERGKYFMLYDFNYESTSATITASDEVYIYNGDGIEVGYIKPNSTISVTELATDGAWARFENPIADTDYDYLYVMDENIVDAGAIILNAESPKQAIIDYILRGEASIGEVDYVILDEKASDMAVHECNMKTVYTDNIDLDYWIAEDIAREIDIFNYQTLYVECEDDVDGWITVTVGYKDKVEWQQY